MAKVTGCVLTIVLANVLVGGIATKYVADFWGSLFRGVPVDLPFWAAILGGLFLGQFTIPGAIATWLISFVLGG